MNFQRTLDYISTGRIKVIYITGKGGVGKSTLSQRIAALGYDLISLDDVIRTMAIDHKDREAIFALYMVGKYQEEKSEFVRRVKEMMKGKTRVVLEGTIKDPGLMTALFQNVQDLCVLYIQPKNLEIYERAVVERIRVDIENNTKTLGFVWNNIPDDVVREFGTEFKERLRQVMQDEWKKIEAYKEFYAGFDLMIVENDMGQK